MTKILNTIVVTLVIYLFLICSGFPLEENTEQDSIPTESKKHILPIHKHNQNSKPTGGTGTGTRPGVGTGQGTGTGTRPDIGSGSGTGTRPGIGSGSGTGTRPGIGSGSGSGSGQSSGTRPVVEELPQPHPKCKGKKILDHKCMTMGCGEKCAHNYMVELASVNCDINGSNYTQIRCCECEGWNIVNFNGNEIHDCGTSDLAGCKNFTNQG